MKVPRHYIVSVIACYALLFLNGCISSDARIHKNKSTAIQKLADNAWLDLELPWRGGHEIPAVVDNANNLFFKYGGCVDKGERINAPVPEDDPNWKKRTGGGYGNSCWGIDLNTLAWRQIRPYDVSWPKDRPGNGCSRSYTYDSKRKVIWMYGGISNGGGGGNNFDLWTYDALTDKFTASNAGNPATLKGDKAPGDVIVYDSKNDLIIMPWGENAIRIYDPQQNSWEERTTTNGPPRTSHYASLAFDQVAGVVVYPCQTRTGKTSNVKLPDTEKTRWLRDKGDGLFYENSFVTWTYDTASNTWTKIADSLDGPSPSPRRRFGLTYDSLNNVIILIGGSTDTWEDDETEYNDVWVLDTLNGRWTAMQALKGPEIKVPHRECRHCAYSEKANAVIFMNRSTGVWAYRYKR